MKRIKNYSLLHNNTFGIDQKCDEFVIFETVDDAVDIAGELMTGKGGAVPFLILGGGSNLLLTKDFHGKVITTDKRFDVKMLDDTEHTDSVLLRCWAGTTFDEVVEYAVEHGLYGMENLSLIPGECGASAVQNIGAYGVEAKDIIKTIEAVELSTGKTMVIKAAECGYGYRQSRFKKEWRDRFLITHVTYRLSRKFQPHLDYGNVRRVLDDRGVDERELTARMLRDIIIDIRRAKLPDPSELGNVGSFFMNPIVDKVVLDQLKRKFPDVRFFEVNSLGEAVPSSSQDKKVGQKLYKIPAGWMIDRCGWKGRRAGRVGVYEKQALVLVNYGGATGCEIVDLMHAIQDDVFSKFGIHIYPEVNIK
jgi:UDP-N-acetylmuramate dehydrogenase